MGVKEKDTMRCSAGSWLGLLLFAALAAPAAAQPVDDGLPAPAVSDHARHLTDGAATTDGATTVPASVPRNDAAVAPVSTSVVTAEGHGATALLGHHLNGETLDDESVRFEAAFADPRTFGDKLALFGFRRLTNTTAAHSQAIDDTGVGLYFGDHGSFKDLDDAGKQAWIDAHKKDGTSPGMPKEASCIGWALENVVAAYEAAGRGERGREISRIVLAKGAKGTDLAKELKKDGWEAVYWNPDVKYDGDGGEHSYSAYLVRKGKPYYGIAIDHTVLNYRARSTTGTVQDMSGIEALSKVPFWFGLARGGRHTFVGHGANVNEFHWTAAPDSKHAIEDSPLAEFAWLSGVIMVPPGTWGR